MVYMHKIENAAFEISALANWCFHCQDFLIFMQILHINLLHVPSQSRLEYGNQKKLQQIDGIGQKPMGVNAAGDASPAILELQGLVIESVSPWISN
jgi:hypothetical protein